MVDHVGTVFLPGDTIHNLNKSEKTGKIIIGPGLRQESETIIVSKPGILRHKEPNMYWIDSYQKRYVPVKGEQVLGVVTVKAGDVFRVDVGGSEQATLSYLSFEGATKRNRPDVKVGDIVFARLLVANKDMEPELICIDGAGRSSGMGVIGRDRGFMFTCSLNLIRKILSPGCILLKTLGNGNRFEITVGMNGRVWIHGRSVVDTIMVANAISAAEFMDNNQIRAMCSKLADRFVDVE
ncbi:hypothetical protein ACJMK2_044781 [Sinanodonta woodiana]|uniref:Exosome complex component RRP40 n=1 Tax=Sinanodonta woodiana TaxID=1069815 RepID=A0ABD3T4A5_SINWO